MALNDDLLEASVMHRIGLDRLATGIRNDIVGQLNDSIKNVTTRLESRLLRIAENGFDSGPATTKRLEDLLVELRRMLAETYDSLEGKLVSELQAAASYEAEHQQKVLVRDVPVGVSWVLPTVPTLHAVVTEEPLQGKLMKEWATELSDSEYARIRQIIRNGVTEGQTVDEMVRAIRGTRALGYKDGVLEIGRRNAETWVRTAVTGVTNGAREKLFEANREFISAVRWVSVLDSRTTPICQARDGMIFPVNEGPRPPAHHNCRSTTVPIVKSAKALGLKDITAGERASMNGQVPADLTYGQWLKKQSAEVVKDVLGPTRAALFLKGGVTVERFVTDQGRSYTLDELRRREAKAFARAGVK